MVISRKGDFSGLGVGVNCCISRVVVPVGVFSRSSGSSGCRLFLVENISTFWLRRAVPLIPLFLGDDDRGGRIGVARVDLRVLDGACAGVKADSTSMSGFFRPVIAH